MMDEATYQKCIEAFKNASDGEEVRRPMVTCFQQIHEENKAYDKVKQDILSVQTQVDKQVVDFDTKVQNAETITAALETAISNGNTAKVNLSNAVNTANTAKTNLINATNTGNTAKGQLETAANNANNVRINAEKAQSDLQGVIDSSVTKKNELQLVIDSANTINNILTETNATASTARTNLLNTINSASAAKSQLESVITNAGTVKTELSQTILNAQTINGTLNGTIETGTTLKQNLDAATVLAKTNLDELRGENFNSQEILTGITDLRATLGVFPSEVVGLTVDLQNKTFTRLASAKGLSSGADFDKFNMFGGRKRCNVADDGTINCYFGESGYVEDGSNGQVMVYQPKFYYLVHPLVTEPIKNETGYHLRKASYYVSDYPIAGFKLHPAFYDAQGNEVDYILLGAYEGSIFDVSENKYILDDTPVMAWQTDKFCSIAGARPASGRTVSGAWKSLDGGAINELCMHRGEGWYANNIKTASANQLLMIIEMGQMNLQEAIGLGVVSAKEVKVTGATSSLGNATGKADGTDGQISITYRGYENPWGNMSEAILGLYINNRELYYATGLNFPGHNANGDYASAGFKYPYDAGWISAIGYAPECDWMFIGTELRGDSSLPVGDYVDVYNIEGKKMPFLGGYYGQNDYAGAFHWQFRYSIYEYDFYIGGRIVYVPSGIAQTK